MVKKRKWKYLWGMNLMINKSKLEDNREESDRRYQLKNTKHPIMFQRINVLYGNHGIRLQKSIMKQDIEMLPNTELFKSKRLEILRYKKLDTKLDMNRLIKECQQVYANVTK